MDITHIQAGIKDITPLVKRQFADEAKAQQFLATAYRIFTDPAMASCTVQSIKLAAYQAAELGLTPVNGQCYFVKYGTTCQMILGYRGMISLAQQAGIGGVQSRVVRQGDVFDYWHDANGGGFRHVPQAPRGAPVTHVWASCKDSTGHLNWVVITRDDIEWYRKRSKSSSGPWGTDFDAMAEKTAIRRLFNRIGMLPSKVQATVMRDEYLSTGAAVRVDVVAQHGQDVAEAVGAEVVETQAQAAPETQGADSLTAALELLQMSESIADVERTWNQYPLLQTNPTFKQAVSAAKDRLK